MDRVAVATARPTPTARQRRVSRVIPASTPRSRDGTGSVRATDTGQLRGWEVFAIVALMRADCGRWAALCGKRGLGLIPVWPDGETSARLPTTSGRPQVDHVDLSGVRGGG